ncbi:chemokine (C-C motif) ligand 3-like precursor [Prionailurus iriomotensis]
MLAFLLLIVTALHSEADEGIIFHTRRGRQICANPSDAWVQEYISNLDNSNGANMA